MRTRAPRRPNSIPQKGGNLTFTFSASSERKQLFKQHAVLSPKKSVLSQHMLAVLACKLRGELATLPGGEEITLFEETPFTARQLFECFDRDPPFFIDKLGSGLVTDVRSKFNMIARDANKSIQTTSTSGVPAVGSALRMVYERVERWARNQHLFESSSSGQISSASRQHRRDSGRASSAPAPGAKPQNPHPSSAPRSSSVGCAGNPNGQRRTSGAPQVAAPQTAESGRRGRTMVRIPQLAAQTASRSATSAGGSPKQSPPPPAMTMAPQSRRRSVSPLTEALQPNFFPTARQASPRRNPSECLWEGCTSHNDVVNGYCDKHRCEEPGCLARCLPKPVILGLPGAQGGIGKKRVIRTCGIAANHNLR